MTKPFQTPYSVDYSQRDPAPEVDALFYHRWSPRSFKPQVIPEDVLTTIFDAARWSQSCYNDQPWLFLTAGRDNENEFVRFLKLLVEYNQEWAKNASLLGFIVCRKHFDHNGKPNGSAKFDCGAAWMAMTLQARHLGLYTHGMGGILRDEVHRELNIPQDAYEVICGFALGCIDTPDHLSDELKSIEAPSPRKPLQQIWHKGNLP